MLIEFQVENFLSLSNRATLSMEKGKYLRKHASSHVLKKGNVSLLKNINIFGPNGSGKSNLLTSLSVFRDLVIRSTDDIEDSLPYNPFKLDNESSGKGTFFSVKFIKAGRIYKYTVRYNSEEILYEELMFTVSPDKEEVYFKRDRDGDEYVLPDALKDIFKTVRRNKLLLFEGQDKNDEICKLVFQWFHSNLIFESRIRSVGRLFKKLVEDEKKKKLFIKLLNLADFNLIDIGVIEDVRDIPSEDRKMSLYMSDGDIVVPKKIKRFEIYSVYKKYDSEGGVVDEEKISFRMESSGTKKMMIFSLLLLDNIDGENVIIMDEFDDSFHLSLAKSLLDMINSHVNKNQFIFTTHNLNLLDSNLRVDQIYFTEKDFLGCTELFSLFDFNEIRGVSKSDIGFGRKYLEGLFGALPYVDLESMKELFEEF